MFEHKIIKADDKAIGILQKDRWGLCAIYNGQMYFKRTLRKARVKVKVFEEQDFYNKHYVKGACSYAFNKDFQELYLEWRTERKLSKSYKNPFNEASEKRVFKKLSKVTKKIAMAMLDNAIENKWLILYDLQEKEKEKIMMELRAEKSKEENKQIVVDIEQQEKDKKKIIDYIKNNPSIKEDARKYVDEHSPQAEGVFKQTLIKTKMRMIARENI